MAVMTSQPESSASSHVDLITSHVKLAESDAASKEDEVEIRGGCGCRCFLCCCRCCCPQPVRAERPVKLWDDGRLLEEEVETYKARVDSVRHIPQLIAREVFECCKHDLDRRIGLLLEIITDLDWLPYFCELTDNHMTSPLVFALSRESNKVARVLTNAGRDMIMITSPPGPYDGVTALHLAVVNNSPQTVSAIMNPLSFADRLELMIRQARGSFFGGPNGIGQVQVLAAMCGFKEIYLQLLDYGGDVDCINAGNGYTVIHALVDYGLQDPVKAIAFLEEVLGGDHSLRWYCRREGLNVRRVTKEQKLGLKRLLLKIENFEGYTPITYAAKIDAHVVLDYLIRIEGVYRHTVWKMGPRMLAMYDMTEIDPTVASIMNPKRPNVLDQLLYTGDADYIASLSKEPLLTLMEFKWSIVMVVYYAWALFHIAMMSGLTYMSMLRGEFYAALEIAVVQLNSTFDEVVDLIETNNLTKIDHETSDVMMEALELYRLTTYVAIVAVILYVLFEIYDVSLSISLFFRGYVSWRKFGHYKVPAGVVKKSDGFDAIVMAFALSALAWFGLEYLHYWQAADFAVSLALVSGWYFSLFFARAYPPTSYFTLMVNRILFTDMARFGLIMIFIIVGFAAAIRSLLKEPPPESFSSMERSIETMFYVLIGSADTSFVLEAKNVLIATSFAIVYIIVACVSMLNMLIAAMSDTYVGISENKDSTARTLRVRSGMIIERRLPHFIMHCLLKRSMKFDSDTKSYFLPVHEVIHQRMVSVPTKS